MVKKHKKRTDINDPVIRGELRQLIKKVDTVKITIPYKARPVQEEIQKHLRENKYSVLVTHRQMGKTICVINHIIREALKSEYPNSRYFYVAPFLKQAKMIAWDHFKYYLKDIPHMKINETELTILLPNGSKIYLVGADNPDAMRGSYANGVVLDEYAMGKDIFEEIIRPMFTNTGGWCVFTSTPKGQNHFYKLWLKSQSGLAGWWGGMYTAKDSGVIPEEEVKRIEAESSSESMFRQEYMCDFMASSDNVLIRIDDVYCANRRQYRLDEIEHSATIIGVDCARYGDDRTVISIRKGLQAFPYRYYQGLNTQEITEKIIEATKDFGYDAIIVDQAYGGGVIDRLREFGYDNVYEVNFNMKSGDEHCKNKRAEMWWKMGEWIRKEGALPESNDLTEELTNVFYGYSTGAGQIQLESKDIVKKRIGKSPDCIGAKSIIRTLLGKKEIQDICIGDMIETPYGYAKVVGIHKHYADTLVWNGLQTTLEHKFYTQNGYKTLRNIKEGDVIYLWNQAYSFKKMLEKCYLMGITFIKTVAIDILSQTSMQMEKEEKCYYTDTFMKKCMGKFLKVMRYITKTTISTTIRLKILKYLTEKNIALITQEKDLKTISTENLISNNLKGYKIEQNSGIKVKLVDSGIYNMQKKTSLANLVTRKLANIVEKILCQVNLMEDSAQTIVQKNITLGQDARLSNANYVEKNTKCISIPKSDIVQETVQTKRDIVYNITLDKYNCYYANDMLVKNCADALALTFAFPIQKRSTLGKNKEEYADSNYDYLEG